MIITHTKYNESADVICIKNNIIFISNRIKWAMDCVVDESIITWYDVPREYLWLKISYVFNSKLYTITENKYSIYDIIW